MPGPPRRGQQNLRPAKQNRRKVLVRVMVALFFPLYWLTLALGGAELVVRLTRGKLLDTTHLSSQYREFGEGRAKSRAEYDPQLGWVPRLGVIEDAGKKYTIVAGNIRSNGREAPVPPRPGSLVLAVGDSFTFGEEVSDHETWPARLEEILRVRVINGGVMNYGFDQAVLLAERLVPRYRPHVLILGFIPHDIHRCEQSFRLAAKPYFVLEDQQLVRRNLPVPLPEAGRPRKMDLFRRVLGYSHLVDLVMRRVNINYWLNIRIDLVEEKGRYEGTGVGDGISIACALVDRLVALGESEDVEIVLLAIHTKHLDRKDRVRASAVVQCAREKGLHVLDLYERLRAVRDDNPKRFAGLYTLHMTAAGNALVAEWLAAFLRDAGLAP